MSFKGIRISKLRYTGPEKEHAEIDFYPGLNVISGASDTGKSFISSTIDFMLGSSKTPPDIKERIGYDRIFMEIQSSDDSYILERSVEGGNFKCYVGLLNDLASIPEGKILSGKHDSADSLSRFLLSLVNLQDKKIKRNQAGSTSSLTIRNLSKLLLINEEQIIKKGTPISTDQYTEATLYYSMFKLLLTGVDDNAIITRDKKVSEIERNRISISSIEHLISDYKQELSGVSATPEELQEQLIKLEHSIEERKNSLADAEAKIEALAHSSRGFCDQRQRLKNRSREIEELLARFNLLSKHYNTDISRLEAVKESGSLFKPIHSLPCPLCGAIPEHQEHTNKCDNDVDAVIHAASSEIVKIRLLLKELDDTMHDLKEEYSVHTNEIKKLTTMIDQTNNEVNSYKATNLSNLGIKFSDLINKRAETLERLKVFNKISSYSQKLVLLSEPQEIIDEAEEVVTDLSSVVLDWFSLIVQEVLGAWQFPESERIHFDDSSKVHDIVINGKPRSSFGKGMRAITYSAVIVALMEYCRRNSKAHPGFIVLDSPLVTYREPEGELDELVKGTNLKDLFYEHLASLPKETQIIILENEHPPANLMTQINFIDFTKNPTSGRYGFFPQT